MPLTNEPLGNRKPIVDIEAHPPEMGSLCFASAGTTTVRGRFVDWHGRPLLIGNTGTSRFTLTVTTATTFVAALNALSIKIPVNAAGIVINTTGSDLYWNAACLATGAVDPSHTDWQPTAAFDRTIPAGSNVIMGRVK